MKPQKLPIGYWISNADTALTNGINSIHEAAGINRTGWQLLNSVKENGSMSKTALLSLLAPLTDQQSIETTLATLFNDQLLEEKQDLIFLTAKGTELHEQCLDKQKAFRLKAMQGINEQDYQNTILTLQRMVENLKNS